ncbi:MAG: class I SAM-dependent methyltransferase [Pseudomonadota bacterium]
MPDEPTVVAGASAAVMGARGCPCCGQTSLRAILDIDDVPTNSCILLNSREEAMNYPVGDMRLVACNGCGFVFNRAFDLSLTEYSGRYEETQSYSETFNRFHRTLAERLIAKYDLAGGEVLEVGCGKGEFLALLAEIGGVRGVGVDPGVHPERIAPELAGKLRFIPEMFAPRHIDRDFDLVGCKMTLEHIPNPFEFVSTIRRGIGERRDCVVFFQVPEAMRILETHAFEDVYYEHCAYYTAGSLSRLFRRAGFDILDAEIEYGGQYLTIEAKPAGGPGAGGVDDDEDRRKFAAVVDGFARGCAETVAVWRARLDEAHAEGETVILWGSGSKAVAFLTAVDPDRRIRFVTDINPHRHGSFMPKSAQPIVPPRALAQIRPDLVIAMNRIYVDEIRKSLGEIGVEPELAAL